MSATARNTELSAAERELQEEVREFLTAELPRGSYVPGLEAEDLDGSLYEVLAARYGIELVSGTSKLEPVLPDSKTAGWLDIPATQPCLASYGISFDRRERVFEYTSAVYRGDRYAFTAELRMTPTVRAAAKSL